MKRTLALVFIGFSLSSLFSLTPHINKGQIEELSLEQGIRELQLTEKELKEINKDFFGVLEHNSNFPAVHESDFNSPVQIFKQTFKETNEVLYRVISYTKEPERFKTKGIFQKGYYSNGENKPNLIFAEFYDTEATIFGQSVTSAHFNYNFMPVIKKNKIAGIMIYGIEQFEKLNSIVEYEGSTEYLYHKAAVYWKKDFSKANLRNEYGNNADIYIECSKPLIDKKDIFKYTIQNAFDKNPATSYVEDTVDDLFNIRFIFAKEMFFNKYSLKIGKSDTIVGISLINGFAKDENLYLSNNRIQELNISSYNLDNKKNNEAYFEKITKKYNGLLKDNNLTYTELQIPKEKFNSVTFSCSKLYKGNKYTDTCLAEFDLYKSREYKYFGD